MLPTMAPVFTDLHAELPRIPWLTKKFVAADGAGAPTLDVLAQEDGSD